MLLQICCFFGNSQTINRRNFLWILGSAYEPEIHYDPQNLSNISWQHPYKKGLTQRESLLISALARQDRKIFSTEDARAATEGDAKKIMSSLIKKKWVLPLRRGLYAIVPLDVGVKGADSFILHNFVIASHLVEPC